MRRWGLMSLFAALGMIAGVQSGFAQDVDPAKGGGTPNIVLFGSIVPNEVGTARNFCTIPQSNLTFSASPSTFQRKGNGDIFIQFINLDYFANPLDYNFGGWAQLDFDDSTSGSVAFDVPPYAQNVNNGNIFNEKGYDPTFNSYSQSYDSTTGVLTVNFNLVFPPANGGSQCSLPIAATYRDLGN